VSPHDDLSVSGNQADPAAGGIPPAAGPPALGRKGRRATAIVLACAVWGFAPAFPGIQQDWRSPWMIGLIVSTPIPAVIVLLIAFAPKIHRFGRWLDSTFGPDAG
jgi:hypothetical protein